MATWLHDGNSIDVVFPQGATEGVPVFVTSAGADSGYPGLPVGNVLPGGRGALQITGVIRVEKATGGGSAIPFGAFVDFDTATGEAAQTTISPPPTAFPLGVVVQRDNADDEAFVDVRLVTDIATMAFAIAIEAGDSWFNPIVNETLQNDDPGGLTLLQSVIVGAVPVGAFAGQTPNAIATLIETSPNEFSFQNPGSGGVLYNVGADRFMRSAPAWTFLASAHRVPVLTALAEAANVIPVTVQIRDEWNIPFSDTVQCRADILDADMVHALVGAFTAAETGAGVEISTTARPSLLFDTDANGVAEVSVTDVSGIFAGTVYLQVAPLAGVGSPRIVPCVFA